MTSVASRVSPMPSVPTATRQLGLSGRLMALTLAFVLIGEIIVFLPMLASFRRTWLNERATSAQMIALVLSAWPPGQALPPETEARILRGAKAELVAVRGSGTRWLITRNPVPSGDVALTIDLRDPSWWEPLRGTWRSLVSPSLEPIRVLGEGKLGIPGVEHVEVLVDDGTLGEAMLAYSRQFLWLSLIVGAVVAVAMFWALHRFIARPVHRLTHAITSFAEAPEDPGRIVTPSGRTDEIGTAERALARMQTTLAGELRHKRHLAEIGLGVSKVSHELRNMLTTAQLLGDRLDGINDPRVQRVAPRLVRTLSRAIEFCAATLAYGRAGERQPRLERIALRPFTEDLHDLAELMPGNGITIDTSGTAGVEIDADPEQLSRILHNLVRNAVQALARERPEHPTVRITAEKPGDVIIRVSDNGPGVPAGVRTQLFGAFETLSRDGGAGLGLAVASELARLHGGRLELEPSDAGASFVVILPQKN